MRGCHPAPLPMILWPRYRQGCSCRLRASRVIGWRSAAPIRSRSAAKSRSALRRNRQASSTVRIVVDDLPGNDSGHRVASPLHGERVSPESHPAPDVATFVHRSVAEPLISVSRTVRDSTAIGPPATGRYRLAAEILAAVDAGVFPPRVRRSEVGFHQTLCSSSQRRTSGVMKATGEHPGGLPHRPLKAAFHVVHRGAAAKTGVGRGVLPCPSLPGANPLTPTQVEGEPLGDLCRSHHAVGHVLRARRVGRRSEGAGS